MKWHLVHCKSLHGQCVSSVMKDILVHCESLRGQCVSQVLYYEMTF